jgi:hypothetical protein
MRAAYCNFDFRKVTFLSDIRWYNHHKSINWFLNRQIALLTNWRNESKLQNAVTVFCYRNIEGQDNCSVITINTTFEYRVSQITYPPLPPLLAIYLILRGPARVTLLIAKHFAPRPVTISWNWQCFTPGIKYLPGLFGWILWQLKLTITIYFSILTDTFLSTDWSF